MKEIISEQKYYVEESIPNGPISGVYIRTVFSDKEVVWLDKNYSSVKEWDSFLEEQFKLIRKVKLEDIKDKLDTLIIDSEEKRKRLSDFFKRFSKN